jgi:hypothetical protein
MNEGGGGSGGALRRAWGFDRATVFSHRRHAGGDGDRAGIEGESNQNRRRNEGRVAVAGSEEWGASSGEDGSRRAEGGGRGWLRGRHGLQSGCSGLQSAARGPRGRLEQD